MLPSVTTFSKERGLWTKAPRGRSSPELYPSVAKILGADRHLVGRPRRVIQEGSVRESNLL